MRFEVADLCCDVPEVNGVFNGDVRDRAEAESSMDLILISNAENPYNLISRSVMHHGSFAK